MRSKRTFQNAQLQTSIYIADSSVKLLNDKLKTNDIPNESLNSPLELVLLSRKLPDGILGQQIIEMLEKLVSAVGLEKSQTRLIELTQTEEFGLNLEFALLTKRLLIFDIPLSKLHLHIQSAPYKIMHWAGVEIIACNKLEILLNDKQQRNQLWSVLKTQYNLS